MRLFKNFLKIYGIALICSCVPFLNIGLIFGFPSTILAAIAVTLVFRKELS